MTNKRKRIIDDNGGESEKPSTKPIKTYTIRAVCRSCGRRTFQNVKIDHKPQDGELLADVDCILCKKPIYCSSVFSVL